MIGNFAFTFGTCGTAQELWINVSRVEPWMDCHTIVYRMQ